ncbi:unnamed protein product, partial [Mesorhabditis spiculigera]
MIIRVYYASETGTAADVAEMLWRDCRARALPATLAPVDSLALTDLHALEFAVFVVATSGQGEFPIHSREFWTRLRLKAIPSDYLAQLKYAVISLGDSSYQKYNRAGRLLRARLKSLGAGEVVPNALCNDQHELGIDGALVPWREQFFEYVRASALFPGVLAEDDARLLLPPASKFELVDVDETEEAEEVPPAKPEPSDFSAVTVLANERVTSDEHFQDTRLITLDNTSGSLSYRPGDVLMVHPNNPEETVDIVIAALNYTDEQLDRRIRLRPTDANIKLPPRWMIGESTTLRECLRRVLDLQHIPKKSFFEILSKVSTDEMERDRLREFTLPENLDELLDYTTRARRTAAEVLRDFFRTAAGLPPQRLFDIFPTIRARAFSIASCPITHSAQVQLLVGKVEYKSRMADRRRGLCSTFLCRADPGQQMFVRVRTGTFTMPAESKPVICVGPGTGVAPFRSLLHYRNALSPTSPAPSMLFFGCRGRLTDYYFQLEWPLLKYNTTLVAFSRDQPEKVYVQDVIANEGEHVWRLIQQGGSILIAGSAGAMPKAVAEAIERIGRTNGGEEEGFVDRLEKLGRIQYETWD